MKPCYHCNRHAAARGSNFCELCGPRHPLFFPAPPRRNKAATRLLYTGAAVTTTWLIYKTVEFVLTK